MAAGRPKKYTRKKLREETERYFRSISRTIPARDDTGGVIRNDDGDEIMLLQYVVPPSIAGLCLQLGIDRSTWQNYADPALHPELADVAAEARARIEAYLEQELLTREKGLQGIIFNLQNNYGWRQKQEVELGEKTRSSMSAGELRIADKLALLAELWVRFEDGSEETIITDGQWKALPETPIRHVDYYMGIEYDARMETPGWDDVNFDDSAWQEAAVLRRLNYKLTAQLDHPVRRQSIITPIALITTPRGEKVLDLGQNMVGWLRFRVKGSAGTRVVISHGEVLDKDGNFYNENYRIAKAEIGYTLSGRGWETFEPQLTFFGFRYVRLENWPCEIDVRDFAGVVISSDIAVTSGFGCSDERVNQLFHNIQWGQRGNFVDVPTDCPQRDERLGWTGDCQAFCRTACINMDSALMLSEWLKDLAFDQREDGAVPYVVPQVLKGSCYGGAAWGDAATIVPWTLYQCYDDKRVLENAYPSMRRWLKYIESQSENDRTREAIPARPTRRSSPRRSMRTRRI